MTLQQVKKQSFFNPSEIATAIQKALDRDLSSSQTLAYLGKQDSVLYAQSRQVHEFRKKFVDPLEDTGHLEALTFCKFLETNIHMHEFNRKEIFPFEQRISRNTPYFTKVLIRAKSLMANVLTPFSEDEWFNATKHSQGSSIGVPYSDTSLERKLKFPMSCTARAKPMFRRYLTFDFQMREAMLDYNKAHPLEDAIAEVTGSRATTVPKSNSIRRMICVEPTCNMFLQQGLMHMLYMRMKRFGLDVETLPIEHKERAMIASITGREATIDWSSASDCVSIELLRWILPMQWFESVDLVRSSVTTLNGHDVKLHMIATMGNATTFPLETLVFWTIAQACLLTEGQTNSMFPEWDHDYRACSVFGDDCIVPTSTALGFTEVLEEIGFILNEEKSFVDEKEQFRESCGGDYLAGYNVRPFYLKAPQTLKKSALEPWLYIIFNSLLKKYISYFGELSYVYDKALFAYLFDVFNQYKIKIKLVPSYYPDDAGLKLSYDIERFALSYRFLLNPIRLSDHGTYSFAYCRFQYREKLEKHGGIRLATWLKKPVAAKRPSLPYSYRRRLGGYVVAKGISCHWHVPQVKAALT